MFVKKPTYSDAPVLPSAQIPCGSYLGLSNSQNIGSLAALWRARRAVSPGQEPGVGWNVQIEGWFHYLLWGDIMLNDCGRCRPRGARAE
jgi:hypothetical protein